MYQIIVRRHQADEARSTNDFVIHGDDLRKLDHQLGDLLRAAQAERGHGVWSDTDPEVWSGGAFVGQLVTRAAESKGRYALGAREGWREARAQPSAMRFRPWAFAR
jgi:hypothetical protein